MNKILVMASALLFAAASTSPAFADNNKHGKGKGNDHPSVAGHGVNDRKHGGKHLDKRDHDHRDRRDDHRDHRYDDNARNDRHDRHDNRFYAKQRYRPTVRYVYPRGYRPGRYAVGGRLPAGYYANNYYVDYRPYRLAAPPAGYQWVRVDNDVYMVSTRDGMVRDILYSLFQ